MADILRSFKITDRETFIKFLDLLLQDFLNALSSYAEDIQGYYDNMKQNVNGDQPNWQTFADIFKGATIYE